MTLDFGIYTKTVYPVCKCESEEYEKQKNEEEQKQKILRLEKLFKQSRLGDRFKRCKFENFQARKGTEKAYQICKDYADNFYINKKDGRGLLLSSIPGTGKTHLAAAITNQLVPKMTSVIFVSVPELLQQIRNTFRGAESEASIMYGLTECDLLILDDIGAEKTTDWTTEKLYTVIDSRYRNIKPIIFTTNCDSEELQERVGVRTFSRIMEMCSPIRIEADDYRLRGF